MVDLVGRAGRAQDVVGGDAALLAGEFIAAARSPDAFEDAVPHQRLQDGLEMARRQPVARRQGFGGHGRPRALSAMSMTAVMANTPLRGRSGMGDRGIEGGEKYHRTVICYR